MSELYFHAAMRECSRDDPLLEGYRLDEELGALIAQRIGKRLVDLAYEPHPFTS
ncbi:MAG: hypothetical protein M3120_03915 [Pseudomonadota bacterium]|nr:hypothetical protein [Pseudomonadota bacterium]